MTSKIANGTRFRSTYADSNAEWEVVGDRGRDTYDCRITDDDLDYAGVTRVFGGEDIRRSQKAAQYFDRAVQSKNDWWANRTVGEVLHYHNSFGAYVRGVVVEHEGKKMMRATALVGAWGKHDLPSRRPNGDISNPYHVQKIIDAAPSQYSDTSMYEHPNFRGPMGPNAGVDPRTAEAINLELPPMTAEEERVAKLERIRDQIRDGLAVRNADEFIARMRELVA
jgi:hypothetical protein